MLYEVITLQALRELAPETSRNGAWEAVQRVLDSVRQQQLLAGQVPQLRQARQQLLRLAGLQHDARRLAQACLEACGELPRNELQVEQP